MPAAPPQIPPEQLAILAKENLGPKVLGLVIFFTLLALICVFLRFFARLKFTQLLGWEDYFIACSMTFSIVTAVLQIKQVEYGSGKHQPLVDLPSTINSLRYLYYSILTYCVGFTFIKISILTQYRRIFSVKSTRFPIYLVMGICVATGTAAFFTFTFACLPISASWNVLKKSSAKCINENAARYANGSLNAATDLLIAALPVRAIWRLQLVRRQRIALILILSLGWFVCIVSILRVHSLFVLARHEQDAMFYSAPPIYWAAIEMNLAIVCACVPALKPLVVKVVPAFSSRQSGNDSQQSGFGKVPKLPRFFHQLSGKQGSSATKSVDLEQGYVGTELDTVTALPPIHRQNSKSYIHVSYELDQQYHPRPSNSSMQRLFPGPKS